MRSLAVFFFAFCFLSVSAVTIYDKTNANLAVDVTGWSTPTDQSPIEAISDKASAKAIDNEGDTRKDGCACKQKSDTQTLTCGVTLALSDQKSDGDLAVFRQAWSALGQTDRNTQLLYLLKRPPRQVLRS